jgi:predicted CopG family antitoxin
MQKKLTITIDEIVYHKLHSVIGERKVSKFIESLVRPFVIENELASAYQNMAKDSALEQEAYEWIEGVTYDELN